MNTLEDQPMSSTDSPVVEIVTILEENGIDLETSTLYDYFDPDSLKQLVASADAGLEVRLTIEGTTLSITQNGVHALDQPSNVRDLPLQP